VTCLEVREHLPEFAVGVLAEPDRTEVERLRAEIAALKALASAP